MEAIKVNVSNLGFKPYTYSFKFDEKWMNAHPVQNKFEKIEGQVAVTLTKSQEDLLQLQLVLSGSYRDECTRCRKNISNPIAATGTYQVRFIGGITTQQQEDELVELPLEADELDIAPLVYELFILHLPLQNTCAEVSDDCDWEVLEKLQNYQDKTSIDNPEEDSGTVDPRWEILKQLKNKNDNGTS